MSVTIFYTEEFESQYKKLPKAIQKKAERREALFRENPFSAMLDTEKLHPKGKEIWSFRIDDSYRILFRFHDRDTIYFLAVGPHGWIYRSL